MTFLLPEKFHPNLLGHAKCIATPQEVAEIKTAFSNKKDIKKSYIFDGGKWIFKLPRNDGLFTTPDTHIYRIRKAEKILACLKKHHLSDLFRVPKKFLYQDGTTFYVVCEKLDLSNEVAKPKSAEIEKALIDAAETLGGQGSALRNQQPHRALTPDQARGLAELSFIGYTDLNYNNLFYTKKGEVAILDTEPVKRALKKKAAIFLKILGTKDAALVEQSLAGTAKLKLYCSDPEAVKQVEKVERKHVLWGMAKQITKIALACLLIWYTPTILSLLSFKGLLFTSLKIAIITASSIRLTFHLLRILSIYIIWHLSHQGLEGVGMISQLEQKENL